MYCLIIKSVKKNHVHSPASACSCSGIAYLHNIPIQNIPTCMHFSLNTFETCVYSKLNLLSKELLS